MPFSHHLITSSQGTTQDVKVLAQGELFLYPMQIRSPCPANYDGCMTIPVYAGRTENPMGMQMTGSGHSDLQAP